MPEASFMFDGTVAKIIKSIEYVRKHINPDFAITQFYLLMLVARNEGTAQRVLAERAKLPHGTVSRNLKQLGTYKVKTKDGKVETKGYNLIELRPDVFDRRITEVYLTQKGKKIVQGIVNAVNHHK